MRIVRHVAAAALLASAFGCTDLEVVNPNQPDRRRILSNPSDVEAFSGLLLQQIVDATHGGNGRIQAGMMTASFMSASTLANNGMGPRSAIPRTAIDNSTGNAYQTENFAEYEGLSFTARVASDVLVQSKDPEFDLGVGREADVQRLNAWTHFAYGVALGYLSLAYDSIGVPRPEDPVEDPLFRPELEGYQAVNAYALEQLDSALAYATQSGTTSLPGGWLTGPSGEEVDVTRFAQVIRSYRAQIRAGVARNSDDRAAVDWNAVIADATAGIEGSLVVQMNPSLGWDYGWLTTGLHYRDANWHQATHYILGMADVSGGFDRWLARPRDQRTPFLIVTPDLRFPQGTTRAAQNRSSDDDDTPLPAGQYYRNRNPGKDQAAVGWRNSWYDHYRFRGFADAARIGPFPLLTQAENDMLAAEGYIRTGDIAAAAALIDRTRTVAGLPALSGAVTSATQPVPGGDECVPRVPLGDAAPTCGNIMEAMKWEKRMETAFTSWGAWFFDSRGWGDLPIGTAVQWPIPSDEADARQIPKYNLGGEGREGGAQESTYGYGVGSR